jgi:hypothetical protein
MTSIITAQYTSHYFRTSHGRLTIPVIDHYRYVLQSDTSMALFTGLPYWYAIHSVTGILLFGPEAYW